MAFRVIIVDDEIAARERLRRFLQEESDVEIVAECEDGHSALSAIREHSPDLVFLDIRIPSLNGFEVIQQFEPTTVPPVILVSADNGHALRAFDLGAVDYLLKPFDRDRFRRSLLLGRQVAARRRARQSAPAMRQSDGAPKRSEPQSDRIAVRTPGKVSILIFAEIDWIESAGNYVELHVGSNTHILRRTLGGLVKKLPPNFVRISKSHIVNIHAVREIKPKSHGDSVLTLRNGTELTVTRSYRRSFKKKLYS